MAVGESFWSSGEWCGIVGQYCYRCCHGAVHQNFVVGDIFPRCKSCHKKVKWYRAVTDTLGINTIEKKPAKNGLMKNLR